MQSLTEGTANLNGTDNPVVNKVSSVMNNSSPDASIDKPNNKSDKGTIIKIISHYKKIGYNINVLQQTACLVVNPITVGNFAFLFNCTPVGRTSDSMMV